MKTTGVERLEQNQMKAIVKAVRRRDVLVFLPTGYGKSLCFALLPLVYDYTCAK